jgi:hypothetical protein
MAKYPILSNQLPKVSKYALQKERHSTKYYRFVDTILADLDNVILSDNDPRVEKIDYQHVDDISVNINEAGYDEDSELPSVTLNSDGKYEVIDHHHFITSLKNRNQRQWYFDVYEYTGSYGDAHKWSAATELGIQINNSHNPTKSTKMNDLVLAGIKKIKDLGYIYEPGTPVDDPHIRMWLQSIKANEVFSAGKITLVSKTILNPSKFSGKKIRNLSTDESREIITKKSQGEYDSGNLSRNRYGYIVCTDNPKADGPKGYNQMVTQMYDDKTPVFITYSKKDDAELILKNHRSYCDKIWETHKKHLSSISKMYRVSIEPLAKEDFFAKIEIVAIGQIDGEYDETDFVSRPLL